MSVNDKELMGLQRTFYPKYSHYRSDGEGRDSYILKNNGGMCNERERSISQSTFYTMEKPRVSIPAAHKEAPSFKYISDGKGRDFYITHNSGGLQAPYVPGSVKADASFIASLRDTKKRNKLIQFASPKERDIMKKSMISQKLLIKRLTSNNSEWKQINQDFRSTIKIKQNGKKIRLPGSESFDYGVDGSTVMHNTISYPFKHKKNSSFHKFEKNYISGLNSRDSLCSKIPLKLKPKFTNRMVNIDKINKNSSISNKLTYKSLKRDISLRRSVDNMRDELRKYKQAKPRHQSTTQGNILSTHLSSFTPNSCTARMMDNSAAVKMLNVKHKYKQMLAQKRKTLNQSETRGLHYQPS